MLSRWSLRARATLACLGGFCLAMLAATWSYAGGSWQHPRARQHLFFENYWCDLLRDPAHNGLPNGTSVRLATLGFLTLAAGLALFWLELSALLPRLQGRFLRAAGVVSSLATALVAITPSDRCPSVHAPAVLCAGGLGFACGCLGALRALRDFRQAPWFALSSLGLIALAATNLVLYVGVAYCQSGDSLVLPAVQKLATLALLGWMVTGLARVNAGVAR